MTRPFPTQPSLAIPNTGRCSCCKGTGRFQSSGRPPRDLGHCTNCRGTGRCGLCNGTGLNSCGHRCHVCG
jgi:hypothetical protein